MNTRLRKPFRAPKEEGDVSSDVEAQTENPHFAHPGIGSQTYRGRFEVQSNIDGYSQSDIFERESQGYLENSKRLLDRLKRNSDSEYGK